MPKNTNPHGLELDSCIKFPGLGDVRNGLASRASPNTFAASGSIDGDELISRLGGDEFSSFLGEAVGLAVGAKESCGVGEGEGETTGVGVGDEHV